MIGAFQYFWNLWNYKPSEPLKAPAYTTPPQTNIQPFIEPVAPKDLRLVQDKYLSLQQKILKRQLLYDTMIIKPSIISKNGREIVHNVPALVNQRTDLMIANKKKYESVSHSFSNGGLKWWVVGLLHELECSQNFNKYLGNGQDLDKVTTIVPKGRGPFPSFKAGAIDALKLDGLDKVQDWSTGNLLFMLEKFNGYGYSLYKNINSPYIFSGSNQYTSGKYIKDGVYDPNAVSSQIGIALLLKNLDSKNFGEVKS